MRNVVDLSRKWSLRIVKRKTIPCEELHEVPSLDELAAHPFMLNLQGPVRRIGNSCSEVDLVAWLLILFNV